MSLITDAMQHLAIAQGELNGYETGHTPAPVAQDATAHALIGIGLLLALYMNGDTR